MFIYTRFQMSPSHGVAHPRAEARPPRRRAMRAVATRPATTMAEPVARRGLMIGIPAPGTTEFRRWSAWLGQCLAEHGPETIEAHLTELARLARHLEPVCSDILDDASAPDVARARAFAKVVAALGRAEPVTSIGAVAA